MVEFKLKLRCHKPSSNLVTRVSDQGAIDPNFDPDITSPDIDDDSRTK